MSVPGRVRTRRPPGPTQPRPAGPAAAVGMDIAFEVDHVDEAMSQGWSVLVVGPASVAIEPDAVRRLAEHAHTEPWAGGGVRCGCRIGPHASRAAASARPIGKRPRTSAHRLAFHDQVSETTGSVSSRRRSPRCANSHSPKSA
jgi:hypothetical protein